MYQMFVSQRNKQGCPVPVDLFSALMMDFLFYFILFDFILCYFILYYFILQIKNHQ